MPLPLNHSQRSGYPRSSPAFQKFRNPYLSNIMNLRSMLMQVRFHPQRPGSLLTASTDGLIAVFDVSGGQLDEDEGFKVGAALQSDSLAVVVHKSV